MSDHEYLALSGIQHMAFCERQWALITIEQLWEDNVLTIEGKQVHERVDDPHFKETRKNVRIVASIPIISHRLRLRGNVDIVEFEKMDKEIPHTTVVLPKRQGYWRPAPIEYKRGKQKHDDRDEVQLCAQAMALEEMLKVNIDHGYIYYATTRQRVIIQCNAALRERCITLSARMHELFDQEKTPSAVRGKHCSLCSLINVCQPEWSMRTESVQHYLQRMMNDQGEEI
jgi:CRISPR-associated exonuclease Cas4